MTWTDNYETNRAECQVCGSLGPEYDAAIQQLIAANPYNYIWFCPPCIRAGYHIEEEYRCHN